MTRRSPREIERELETIEESDTDTDNDHYMDMSLSDLYLELMIEAEAVDKGERDPGEPSAAQRAYQRKIRVKALRDKLSAIRRRGDEEDVA